MQPAARFDARRKWHAAIYSGITAALVSLAIETPLVWLLQGELPWAAARMTAAMLLGTGVLIPPDTFDFRLVMLALGIHIMLSVLYGLIFASVTRGMTIARAAVIGAAFGLLLFVVNLYGIAPILFPWFLELRGGITVFSHLVFGAVLGGSYVTFWKR